MIPFEDDHNGILSEIEQLGEKFVFLLAYVIRGHGLLCATFFRLDVIRKIYSKKLEVERN